MKTATSLTVIAIGAILAFAITASPSFLDLNTVGWIFMLTGACGIALTPRGRNWLRRRIIVRGAPGGARASRATRQRTRSQAPPDQAQPDQAPPDQAPQPDTGVPQSGLPSDEPRTQPLDRPVDPAVAEPPAAPTPDVTIEEYIEQ